MPPTRLIPAKRPDLITLELGDQCYGVTAIVHEQPLDFEPLPAGVPQPENVCGLVRIGDGMAVPVFDLRTPRPRTGTYRLVIAAGYRGEGCLINLAFLIDAAAPSATRPRKLARRATPASAFSRN